MVTVTLPDGSRKDYPQGATPLRVAEDISPRLAKAALVAEVDGRLTDVAAPLPEGTHTVRVITDRDAAGLEVLRHTTAHVLAQAVRRLYGQDVKYTIGPALVDDFQYGFYYDFDLPRPIAADDLPKIEAEMKKIAAEKIPLQRLELSVEEAKNRFAALGQSYKVEMIDDLARKERVAGVSLYSQGDFLDMCRGPHLPDTGRLRAFKLLTTAGAYWRGSEKNRMLTRVYGTAFFDDKTLQEHLARIEEARKRDHRVLGKQLGLFLLSDIVGPGLPLWMPKGAIIRREMEDWLRGELVSRGYQIVYTPHIGRLELYRTSGHYPYYRESQYPPILESQTLDALAREGCSCSELSNRMTSGQLDGYLLKPMNCPHHIQIYRAEPRSYRDLPVRLAEFGTVYRYEQSGELSGMVRVRGFTQDDAHIFCSPDQLEDEVASCVDLVKLVLTTLGLSRYHVKVSLRDPAGDKYVGSAENWEQAERNLRNVVQKLGMAFTEAIGEAAFYGPKIDFIVNDSLGREWQLGTIQVDYNLPQRFALEYAGADNAVHRPVMVHRAPFGSMERFVGLLIEHYAGAFPLWLSPVQAAVLPVSDKFNEYGRRAMEAIKAAGIRAELDDSPEKIGSKIRRATMEKVPYMAVVGQREQESGQVAVRHRVGGDRGAVALERFVAALKSEIESKSTVATAFAPPADKNQ
jgi:threonyl-tRNA synthetase